MGWPSHIASQHRSHRDQPAPRSQTGTVVPGRNYGPVPRPGQLRKAGCPAQGSASEARPAHPRRRVTVSGTAHAPSRLLKPAVSSTPTWLSRRALALALQIKDWLKEAFELRLAGNYERAEDTLQFAFRQFAQESETRWKEYQTATEYQERVRKNLQKIVKGSDSGFNGRVRKTALGLSLLPLIDLVMDFDGPSVLEALTARGLTLCPELIEHLQQHKLRAGVIVRPGQSLNSEELVAKLGEEVKNGALRLTCFLLIQNCKGSESAKEFRSLAIRRGMHATSLEWEPYSGREKLADALQEAILTVCDPSQCISQAMQQASPGLPRPPGHPQMETDLRLDRRRDGHLFGRCA